MEELICVSPDLIRTRKQVREQFNADEIAGLAQSMAEVGQLQPLRTQLLNGEHWLVDGERRLQAARLLQWTEIAVIAEVAELSEGEVLQRQLVANCQRADLAPVERAQGIHALITATGWSATEAAKRLGLSPASVSRSLSLLNLPEPIRAAVASGHIGASAACELLKVSDPGQQARLAQQLAAGQIGRDEVVGARKQRAATASGQANRRLTAALGQGRSLSLSGVEPTLQGLIETLEELLAKARKARPQGLALPTFLKMLKDQAS